jgi:hypothetical protein
MWAKTATSITEVLSILLSKALASADKSLYVANNGMGLIMYRASKTRRWFNLLFASQGVVILLGFVILDQMVRSSFRSLRDTLYVARVEETYISAVENALTSISHKLYALFIVAVVATAVFNRIALFLLGRDRPSTKESKLPDL